MTRPHFTDDFKIDAIKQITERGYSVIRENTDRLLTLMVRAADYNSMKYIHILSPLRSILLVALWLFLMNGAATAGTCGCGPRIPIEGEYNLSGGTLLLTYEDGDASTCPTQIKIERTAPLSRDGVQGTKLTCEGGSFVGKEKTEMGVFGWIVTPGASDPEEASTLSDLPVFGISHSSTVEIIIRTPKSVNQPMIPNGRDRVLIATTSAQRGAPCICEKIRQNLRLQQAMLAAHQDMGFAQESLDAGHLALNSDLPFYGDPETGQIRLVGGRVNETTYQEQILERVRAQLSGSDNTSSGGGHGGATTAFASAGGANCEITVPHQEAVEGACIPAVLYQAVLAHEEIHSQQCRVRNAHPRLQKQVASQQIEDWLSFGGRDSGWTRKNLTPNAIWGNNPLVLGHDEAVAYTASIAVLQKFLAAYCNS